MQHAGPRRIAGKRRNFRECRVAGHERSSILRPSDYAVLPSVTSAVAEAIKKPRTRRGSFMTDGQVSGQFY
jgi:hypothetical protein